MVYLRFATMRPITYMQYLRSYGTAQFKLYKCMQIHDVYIPHVKLQNSACARHLAHRFSMCMNARCTPETHYMSMHITRVICNVHSNGEHVKCIHACYSTSSIFCAHACRYACNFKNVSNREFGHAYLVKFKLSCTVRIY